MRKMAPVLITAFATLIYMPVTSAAEPVAPQVVTGGEDSATVVNATDGSITAGIGGLREVEALSLDDRRSAIWLVDRDGLLLRYGLDGIEQQRIDLRAPVEPAWEPADGADERFGDVIDGFLSWLFDLLQDAQDFGDLQHAQLVADKIDGAAWIVSHHTLRRYAADGTLQLQLRLPYDAEAIAFDWRTRQVWVGGEQRLRSYGVDGALVHDIDTTHRVQTLAFDNRAQALWIGDSKNLAAIDRDGNLVHAFRVQHLEHLAVGNDSTLWIAKTKTVYHYSADGALLAEYNLSRSGPPVKAIAFEPNRGELWLSRDRALLRMSADGTVTTVLDDLRKQDVLAANGDITPPTLSLLEPADNALIRPRPAFRLQAADAGLGIDAASTQVRIDAEPVVVDCTWEADVLVCTPVADITAFQPVVEVRVVDFAGNLSEPASVTLRLDSDGDGVEDAHDTYPHDPTRHQLARVEGITVALDDTAARIDWQAHADPQNTGGYLVFRTMAGNTERMQLTAAPVTDRTYADADIENGRGYVYDVIAVDARGNVGEAGEGVQLFAAWNDMPVSGFVVTRELAAGRISWQQAGELRYRIYRSSGEAEFTAVQDLSAETVTWLDESTLWHTAYRYRIASLRDFTNVFTNEAVTIEGPLSEAVELLPLPPLAVTLNDGVIAPDGVREILLIQSPVAISGTYLEAHGPVTVAASNGVANIAGSFSDGGFRLLVPATAGETWTITVSEQLIADRQAQTTVRFIADTMPPAIALNVLPAETEDDFLLVTGTVTEHLSGLDTLAASSDRYSSQSFGLVLGEAGQFSGEVPLENGTNIITVRAVDGAGNAADVAHTVKRKPPLKPTIELDTPQDGAVTQQSTITVSGRVYTRLEADQVRIVLGGEIQFPEEGDGADGYHFVFENVALREGYNLISVSAETPAGSATASAIVTYETEPPAPVEPEPLALELSTNLDIITNGDSFAIGGSVTGDGDLTVTINGEVVDLIGGSFEYLADLAECVNGSVTFTVTVTDDNGNSTTETVTVDCDREAPQLVLTSPNALTAPAVTTLPGNPVQFTGTVTDAHLGGLTLNGNPVVLAPGAQPNEYTFDTLVLLPANVALPVHLETWDAAGNRNTHDVVLQVASNIGIEVIAPLADAEYLAATDNVNVSVTARFTNFDATQHLAYARIDNAEPIALAMSANVGNTVLAVPAAKDKARITVLVKNTAGNVVASRFVDVNITDATSIPLDVVRTEPVNNATGIAPINPITIYFNKPIDPAKLVVTVSETVHGMDYDLSNQQAKGFGEIPEPQLVEIHRDMETVAGGLAFFEGDRFVSFHPEQRFGYGADVYVEVVHDGDELARFTYAVQPLPTIIHGKVLDALGNPVAGVRVTLHEDKLSTVTDDRGGYSFGSGSEMNVALPGGRRTFHVNQEMAQGLGAGINQASVQQHRLNAVPTIRLPVLDQDIPFARLNSGQPMISLDGGRLKLDLSNARLSFPDGRSEGAVHVQFTTLGNLVHPTAPGVTPYWVYAVQPAGVAVNAELSLDIEAPALYGSLDYLPEDGALVVIVGLDTSSGSVLPVGVGVVDNGHIRNVGPALQFNRLDVIGFALVTEDNQELLARYRDGEISSLTQLLQSLAD